MSSFNSASFPSMPFKPFVQPQPRIAPRRNNGQCTHLTMTRLYSRDFRCVVCLRLPSVGWLYRCTQDRELLLEDEFDKGEENSELAVLCNIFDRPQTPRKRGPAARASVTSFLDETSDEGIKTYSDEQLNLIFEQRAHALEVAIQESQTATPEENSIFSRFSFGKSSLPDTGESSAVPSERTPTKVLQRPWVPAKGTECQFKCCARCRPTLADRAFLSLDGIVNNDIPFTAMTGFGFHLRKGRPVGLVQHVKNLGLRPSPPFRPRNSLETRAHDAESGMGLGLFDTNAIPLILGRPLPSPPTSSTSSASSTTPDDFDIADYYSSSSSQASRLTPLAQAELSELTFRAFQSEGSEIELANRVPLPPPTPTEAASYEASLTHMEEDEAEEGEFGSEPLEVKDGIAVTEEAVGLHVADLVTQV